LYAATIQQVPRRRALYFEYLTFEDGLVQNTVHGIAMDKLGFMWFGTWNGLCRYDGYKFRVYRADPSDSTSLVSNRIHLIYKDTSGTLWISAFDSIVCRY
jgi:ligand-binding sensor domain-containing protein